MHVDEPVALAMTADGATLLVTSGLAHRLEARDPASLARRFEGLAMLDPLAADLPLAAPAEAAPEVVAAPVVAEPAKVEMPKPTPAPVAPSEPPPPPPRVSSPPKTGIEVWAGRPGVPMPTPAGVSRTGIGGGSVGTMARRSEFNPRASGPTGGMPQRGGLRGGPQMGRGGPMGRGFPGGKRGFGPQVPGRKPAVSTQEMSAHKKVIRIEENITLQNMAQKMSLKATEVLMKLIHMGMAGVQPQ